jgi:hypothetical protein
MDHEEKQAFADRMLDAYQDYGITCAAFLELDD